MFEKVVLKASAKAPLPAEGSRKRVGAMLFSFRVPTMVLMISGGV
jgi:hypothetical protein